MKSQPDQQTLVTIPTRALDKKEASCKRRALLMCARVSQCVCVCLFVCVLLDKS